MSLKHSIIKEGAMQVHVIELYSPSFTHPNAGSEQCCLKECWRPIAHALPVRGKIMTISNGADDIDFSIWSWVYHCLEVHVIRHETLRGPAAMFTSLGIRLLGPLLLSQKFGAVLRA